MYELSIVIPCLNEAETIGTCIDKSRTFLERNGVAGEIIVADNGSTDGSQEIAGRHGARVVHAKERGYGSALSAGINAAGGTYVIIGDADDSYDFTALEPFLTKLREGYDIVMGNRFKGGIKPNAMPLLHQYLGNPVLTFIGRLFFKSPVGDFHCGLRGFRKSAVERLNLRTTGMEFASEMIVKATLHKLRITEVPTSLSPDGRSRPSHLRTWRDGWRHLRFLLLYSPDWLFLYPGVAMIAFGTVMMMWLLPGPRAVYGVTFNIHTLLYAAMAVILGVQTVSFAVFSRVFAAGAGLVPQGGQMWIMKLFTLERGILVGVTLILIGAAGSTYGFVYWRAEKFGQLDPSYVMRLIIPALTALTAGFQVVFSSFFLSVLSLKHR